MRRSLALTCIGALWLVGGISAETAPPSAYDLLQQVREAYLVLGAYRDEGEIERRSRLGQGTVERFEFATELEPGGAFRFELHPVPAEPTGGAIHWNRAAEERGRSVAAAADASLPAGIGSRLGVGAEEALLVASLLARGSRALPDPEVLALDGEEPCGETTCLILAGARDGGTRRFSIWVDSATRRVRRIEVEVDPGPDGAGSALAVTYRPSLALRAESRERVAPEPDELATFGEQVDVTLTSIAVRVLDRGTGENLRGLGAADFRLLIGGRELPIDAVEWVSSHEPFGGEEALDAFAAAGIEPPSAGKLVVFFVQADLRPSRMIGQMRTLPEAKRFLDTLALEDRVAVVSFDSHLKLRQDFTLERGEVRAAFDQAMLVGPEPWLRAGREPSLARHFDLDAARDAAVPERGLEVTARALEPLPGEKVIVFVGWGLGRFGQLGVEMIPAYGDALQALARARATVFALDVTDADYHSLEVGLKQIASDTGGKYLKTTYHPKAAANRLADLVSGFYRVTFQAPADAGGERIRIELRDRRLGEVVAPRWTLDAASGG